ncbi:hypothetical protein [Bacillus cihuensis]|uniref:hypothetical protein n=1 Tax=Bacillus cihuensis TaxID=1208599 RepID=UPI0003FC40BD|nr:hypothetical protein [Bacillus cihuensis]
MKEGKAAWDAYQYYKDGSVVEWTGDKGSNLPHSITSITTSVPNKTEAATDHNANDIAEKTTDTKTKATDNKTTNTGMILSIIALVLSIVALVMSFIRRK